MIDRIISPLVKKDVENLRKIILIFGARQVGKTTLIRRLLKELPYKSLEVNGDEKRYVEILSSQNFEKMMGLVGTHNLLFIDEAQNIPNIGLNLKILFDNHPDLKIIATGSSSFDLAQKVIEPLTGRTRTWELFPISMQELSKLMTPFELNQQVENSMVFGMYPEVLTNSGSRNEKIRNLKELSTSYLYKDILELSKIRYSDKLHRLLRSLALNIGKLISLNEIAKELGISHEAVSSYVDMLEKGFIIFRLPAYSNNPKEEISKSEKIYFHDLGIRNMLIENFNEFSIRQDQEQLWENLIISERLKKMTYQNAFYKPYFWKNYSGTEIHLIEYQNEQLKGFDIRLKPRKRNTPKSWAKNYSNTIFNQIDRENFIDFIT